jgi:mono/diheme cytochrome c family protein
MRKLGLLLVCVAACSSPGPRLPTSPQGTPVLELRGAVKGGPYALGQADLEKLPRRGVRGADPLSGQIALWSGISVGSLVTERVELARGADTVVVRTADRAAIPIPLTVIRQLNPVLADRADATRLGTPLLAWPTEQQQGLATDPRAVGWWARDVVAFEIVAWNRTFGPALAPPDGAADAARRGAGLYAESCVACHRMRGVGGERGPDLTTVAERLRPAAFDALLTGHPGWRERPRRDDADGAAEIWAFLRTIAAAVASGVGVDADATATADPVPAR